jgi:hypothetical protein
MGDQQVPRRARFTVSAAQAEQHERLQRLQAADRAAREALYARPAGPHDALADSLMDLITDEVFKALIGPDFAAELALRGYQVVPVPAGDVPVAPVEWMDDGLDVVIGAAGELRDPLAHLDDMWRRAYLAGWQAHAADVEVREQPAT